MNDRRAALGLAFMVAMSSGAWAPAAWAQHPDAPADRGAPPLDVTSLDLEALMNLDVTTASRFAEKVAEAPGIMSVVTRDELHRFGAMRLSEILQRVPGLNASTSYLTDRHVIAARGDQTKVVGGHILFLINGHPTREIMEGGIFSDLVDSFPVDILDHIEVIRGPGSVLYGSNAFSAVVNLITRKADQNQATATASGGPGGAAATSAAGTYTRGAFSAVAAGELHKAPDWPVTWLVPLSDRLIPIPRGPDVQNFSAIDRGTGGYLGLNYKGVSLMSSFTESQSNGFTVGAVSETRLTRDFANLGYDRKVTRAWDMSFNATVTRTTFAAPEFPSVARDSHEYVVEWTNLITLSPRDRLTFGTLFSHVAGVEEITSITPHPVVADGTRNAGAFYLQIDHQLADDLKLVGGFQTNTIGNIPVDTVPRAGIIWTPSAWSVKALYGQAFRAPSLDETLLNHPTLEGNPNLRPEKVATFDLGIGFQKNRIQAGFDYFHSDISNSIANIPDGGRFKFVNLDTITFNGIELEGKYYFIKDFFAQGSLLRQTNVDQNGNHNVSPIPVLSYKAGLSYQGAHHLTASLFEVFDGPVQGFATALNPVGQTNDVLNAYLRYDLPRYRSALVVHANNLTDHPVWLPSGITGNDSIPVQQGRVVYIGLEFSTSRR